MVRGTKGGPQLAKGLKMFNIHIIEYILKFSMAAFGL